MRTIGIKPAVDLTGGDSVYCINEAQMKKAVEMFQKADPEGELKKTFEHIKTKLSRNDQAALSFVLIEELRK